MYYRTELHGTVRDCTWLHWTATEIRSARTYWHVQAPEAGVTRIYPAAYLPRVSGQGDHDLPIACMLPNPTPYPSYTAVLQAILRSFRTSRHPKSILPEVSLNFFLNHTTFHHCVATTR